jgi:hypothetical protein
MLAVPDTDSVPREEVIFSDVFTILAAPVVCVPAAPIALVVPNPDTNNDVPGCSAIAVSDIELKPSISYPIK